MRASRIVDVDTFFGLDRSRSVTWSLDELRRLLDEHAVERALTISLRGACYGFLGGNEDTLAASRLDSRLVPVATVHPGRYLDCPEEIRRCVGEGMGVFRFFPALQSWSPSDLHFLRLAEEVVAAGGRALMLNADRAGWPSALARHLGDLEIPVVMLSISYGNMAEALAAMKAAPNLCIDGVRFDTPWAYEVVCDEVGHERLFFGSGLPDRYFSSAFGMLWHSEVSDAQRAAIFYHNAARMMGWEG